MMNIRFLLLIAASGLLRYVAIQAKHAFALRLAGLLPRKIQSGHVQVLFDEYRSSLTAFRQRALPYSGLELGMNALACASFVAALWTLPPQHLSEMNVFLVRYASSLLVGFAFVVDFFLFCRLAFLAIARAESTVS